MRAWKDAVPCLLALPPLLLQGRRRTVSCLLRTARGAGEEMLLSLAFPGDDGWMDGHRCFKKAVKAPTGAPDRSDGRPKSDPFLANRPVLGKVTRSWKSDPSDGKIIDFPYDQKCPVFLRPIL